MANQLASAAPKCSICQGPFKTDKDGKPVHDDCAKPPPLPVPVQFIIMVFFAICTGLVLDLFNRLAHLKKIDRLALDWRSLPLFLGGISVFLVILGVMVFAQEKLIEVKKHPVTFIAAFVLAASISGYFYLLSRILWREGRFVFAHESRQPTGETTLGGLDGFRGVGRRRRGLAGRVQNQAPKRKASSFSRM